MPLISEARYVFHKHEITDHAIFIFTIDIENTEQGKGLFRANQPILKDPNYSTLINNVIRHTVIDEKKSQTHHYTESSKNENFAKRLKRFHRSK